MGGSVWEGDLAVRGRRNLVSNLPPHPLPQRRSSRPLPDSVVVVSPLGAGVAVLGLSKDHGVPVRCKPRVALAGLTSAQVESILKLSGARIEVE